MDYSKLRVKQLKQILENRGEFRIDQKIEKEMRLSISICMCLYLPCNWRLGVKCKGCLEKSEYVQKCKDTEHLEL